MKITTETQYLMIIKDGRIFVYFVGLVFTAAGVVVIFKPDFFMNAPPLWSGIAAILFGIFIIFVNKSIVITLDKNVNKLMILKKRMIGGNNLTQYELNQIKEIELSQSYYVDMSRQGRDTGLSYALWFVLNDGQRISLNQGSQTIKRGMAFGKPKEQIIGERIAKFLGIPFQERRPPTVGEVLGEIKDAIGKQIEERKDDLRKTNEGVFKG